MNAAQAKLAVGFLQSAVDDLTAERDRLRAINAELVTAITNYFRAYENEGKRPGWLRRVFWAKEEIWAAIEKATS